MRSETNPAAMSCPRTSQKPPDFPDGSNPTLEQLRARYYPGERERLQAAGRAAFERGEQFFEFEYRYLWPDGDVRWLMLRARIRTDAHGRPIGAVGVVADVTERKRAEEKLIELNNSLEQRVSEALAERKLLADIVDGTDIFVQVVDLDYNWLAINKAAATEFARIFGVRPPKAGDNMLAMLQDKPEHQTAVKAVWARALAGEEFVQIDAFGDPSHDRRHYEMRFRLLRDGTGQLRGAYQFVSDITDRLREQDRLRDAEAALAQAQKMEAVGQLTGGIAHDFNNLLQGVAGSLDLIRRRPGDSARVQHWAEAGLKAAERGAKLTGQLLAFSRAQKMELKPVPLSDVVAGFRNMIERTIGPQISIRLDLGARGLRVLGDQVQIEMAVLNLALNARDAMPGGGTVRISTRPVRIERDRELVDGDYVELAVSDTGEGMAPDVVARAVDPFFTTKGPSKGTGLGLSQVYGALRQAGGAVRIESRVGAGTTVRLLFRRTDDAVASPSPEPHEPNGMDVSARVLIVDDDPDVRRFLVESLHALGFTTIEAEDGHAGFAELERSCPDLMILDFAMPGLNGAEVARQVQQARPDFPIILATGFADSAALEWIAACNMPIIRKPFSVDELRRALHLAFQNVRSVDRQAGHLARSDIASQPG